MAQPVSFRWDEGFLARIDEARGGVPRARWVREAVEAMLGGSLDPVEPIEKVSADMDRLKARHKPPAAPGRKRVDHSSEYSSGAKRKAVPAVPGVKRGSEIQRPRGLPPIHETWRR